MEYKKLLEIQKQIPHSKIIKKIGLFGLWENHLYLNGQKLNIKEV